MAHPAYLREKARELRIEKRLSLLEIAERLALPKTTVYYWIRDLPDPEIKYRDTPARARAQALGNQSMRRKYRALRERAYQRGRAEFAELATDSDFRDFVCLYIAEGFKRNRNRVEIGNSDPAVLTVATRWLRRLTSKRLYFALKYHPDQDPEQLRRFWASALIADPESFRFQRKSNSSKLAWRQWRCQHGVLSVGVDDTYLRARLQAWMDELRQQWLDSR